MHLISSSGIWRDLPNMNTRPVIEPSISPVALYAAFNDDATCFSVGLDSGFCSKYFEDQALMKEILIFVVFNSDPCELRVSRGMEAC